MRISNVKREGTDAHLDIRSQCAEQNAAEKLTVLHRSSALQHVGQRQSVGEKGL